MSLHYSQSLQSHSRDKNERWKWVSGSAKGFKNCDIHSRVFVFEVIIVICFAKYGFGKLSFGWEANEGPGIMHSCKYRVYTSMQSLNWLLDKCFFLVFTQHHATHSLTHTHDGVWLLRRSYFPVQIFFFFCFSIRFFIPFCDDLYSIHGSRWSCIVACSLCAFVFRSVFQHCSWMRDWDDMCIYHVC